MASRPSRIAPGCIQVNGGKHDDVGIGGVCHPLRLNAGSGRGSGGGAGRAGAGGYPQAAARSACAGRIRGGSVGGAAVHVPPAQGRARLPFTPARGPGVPTSGHFCTRPHPRPVRRPGVAGRPRSNRQRYGPVPVADPGGVGIVRGQVRPGQAALPDQTTGRQGARQRYPRLGRHPRLGRQPGGHVQVGAGVMERRCGWKN